MSNQSMASGDPWCDVHGFNPCSCRFYPDYYYKKLMLTAHQTAYSICETCKKHVGTCVCAGSSDPWADRARLTGQVPEGTQICVDVTKPQVEVPIKKWADELKEIATDVSKNDVEGKSAYYFFLERSKMAAKKGSFSIRFWMSKLPWTKQELELAADLLRKDNFEADIETVSTQDTYDVEIVVSWQ